MDVVGLCCLLPVQLAFEALEDIKIGDCWCPGSRAWWPSACVSCPRETAQADKQSFPHHGLIQVRGSLHPSVGKRRDILCVCHRQPHAHVSGLVYTHDWALGASWDTRRAGQACPAPGCWPGLMDSIPLPPWPCLFCALHHQQKLGGSTQFCSAIVSKSPWACVCLPSCSSQSTGCLGVDTKCM